MAQGDGDVISVLTHDHREVEHLFGKRVASTRPHPSAPSDQPELMKVHGPGAGLVDRARDAQAGRGK